ncbi:hypothetical protein PRELSG_0027280 [Plasmodium relictum]|uniref:Uncharacterized protein n=1 Tax=Plasmodium relictum TaxID=85471 RepID=A0A1J1GN68_PLARL|nr:hypothetical protein PRELSG_0027280 [Plasmodium relictum]CRG84734.1 hypothetical protein PRELSG_0027280 [Plasmodium relictum]
MEIIQKKNFNEWNEAKFERNLRILHTYTKSKEFSIDAYVQKDSDISNKDINNISSISFSNNEILGSLITVKKRINNKDNKIANTFPTSESVSSDILDEDDISFNNETIKTMKTSYYFNLSKIVIFLHKIHFGKKLNKKSYMSCIISIIILFLQPVNTTERRYSNKLSFLCKSLSTMCGTNDNYEGTPAFYVMKDEYNNYPKIHILDLVLQSFVDEVAGSSPFIAFLFYLSLFFLICYVMNNNYKYMHFSIFIYSFIFFNKIY